MKSLVRSLVFAAAGFAAASMYRQWADGQQPSRRRHKMPLENWENEGGALPDVASADQPPASRQAVPTDRW
jgi:hypothetical protein